MKDFDKIIGRNAITMIYFFTSQCVPCEAMEPVLDQFERRMAGRVDIYRINTDADENAYLLYRGRILPDRPDILFRLPALPLYDPHDADADLLPQRG